METKVVTCPETTLPERIEYEAHPLGILITACSRFQPACDVTCQRMCAAKLDRRGPVEPSFEDDEEDTLVNIPAEELRRWLG